MMQVDHSIWNESGSDLSGLVNFNGIKCLSAKWWTARTVAFRVLLLLLIWRVN